MMLTTRPRRPGAGKTDERGARNGDDRPRARRNLSPPELVEQAVRRGEGRLTDGGAFAAETGEHTGRSARDKYVAAEEPGDDEIWWGEVNQPMSAHAFRQLQSDLLHYLAERDRFELDLHVCADPAYALPVRIVAERAWQALFARSMFRRGPAPAGRRPLTILHAPGFRADPRRHETRSSTVIALSFEQRLVLIAGTDYAGEIKKSVFTALQGLLPRQGVATMHCSANAGEAGDVALFFGLSGTGKTTLSTDGERWLIGDDEHGWSDEGIFNFEGGSYAKVINLSEQAEPQIHAAANRFGSVLENVVLDPATRAPIYADDALTENTRAAFPLETMDRVSPTGRGGHPRNILFLSADAFGVLPPVARLTEAQALFWFLSGYTAKLAGTERGVENPTATFSACFGAPFLPLPPARYAELLGERLRRHGPAVWLVNTGWSGGAQGAGERMPLRVTRAIVRAILDGSLRDAPTRPDPLFGFDVPTRLPGVPDAPLDPRAAWADPHAYDRAARRLAIDLADNFRRYAADVPPSVRAAGPRV